MPDLCLYSSFITVSLSIIHICNIRVITSAEILYLKWTQWIKLNSFSNFFFSYKFVKRFYGYEKISNIRRTLLNFFFSTSSIRIFQSNILLKTAKHDPTLSHLINIKFHLNQWYLFVSMILILPTHWYFLTIF